MARNEVFLYPSATRLLRRQYRQAEEKGAASPIEKLSDRERELLPLLAGTLSQREIGGVLHLSLNTVKTHSRVLFRKLGVSSRAEAVRRGRELGLL